MKKAIILIIILAAALGGYLFIKSRTVVKVDNAPAGSQGDQALLQETIDSLSKFIVLPEGDSPILATVSDPTQLAGEAFFKNAQVGDRVLVYPKARVAILYRPSINKIIQMESVPEAATSTGVSLQ